jgi:hypothetical protein
MNADIFYFPPIAGEVINGPWRGRVCLVEGWAGNTRVWVQFAGDRRLYQLRRDELKLRDRPARVRPPPPPPPAPEWFDDGSDWPGAA